MIDGEQLNDSSGFPHSPLKIDCEVCWMDLFLLYKTCCNFFTIIVFSLVAIIDKLGEKILSKKKADSTSEDEVDEETKWRRYGSISLGPVVSFNKTCFDKCKRVMWRNPYRSYWFSFFQFEVVFTHWFESSMAKMLCVLCRGTFLSFFLPWPFVLSFLESCPLGLKNFIWWYSVMIMK